MNQLLEALRPHVEALARDYVSPASAVESASDIVQDVELRVWQRLGQFRGGANDAETFSMLRAWIAQVVRSVGLNAVKARNALRRTAPEGVARLDGGPGLEGTLGSAASPADSGPSPSTGAREREAAAAVQAALEGIADLQGREIVRLCFFEGLSFREIAEALGLTYDQVRHRYHAALKLLEGELRAHGQG